MKTMQLETGILPGDTAANLQVTAAERAQRATGFLSMLAERFRESADVQKENTILVLPSDSRANLRCTAMHWRMPLPRGWPACLRWWCGLPAR